MAISQDQIEDKPKILSDQTAPTTGAGKGAFFPQDVGGRVEAHYVDDTGAVTQITELGTVKALGESNTASNVGAGQGSVFLQKTGVDLEFKTILAGTGITVLDNTNTIEISSSGVSGEANTASNVGAGNQLFKQKSGVDLQFRTLVAGSGIAISAGTDEITITNLGSSGEANTASNTGAGSQVFKQKSGVDLQFRTLVAGANISLTQNADTIDIAASGGGSSNTTAVIVIPTAGSLSARLAAATGIPAGWSLVEGNDGSVNGGLTSVGATAGDVVIITGEGKPAGSVKVMKDFGGLVRQQVTYDPSTGDILESNDYNQILLKTYEDAGKAGTAQSEIVIIMPA